jgi:hypothetical protein
MQNEDIPLTLIHRPSFGMVPQDLEGIILRYIDIAETHTLQSENNIELILESSLN